MAAGASLAGSLAQLLVPARLVAVLREVVGGGLDPGDEDRVGGERVELVGGVRPEQRDRVVPGRRPALRVQLGEQVAGRRVPGPAQVAGQDAERLQRFGQDGAHAEAADRSHEGAR